MLLLSKSALVMPEPPARQEISRPDFVIDVPKEIEGLADDDQFEVTGLKL